MQRYGGWRDPIVISASMPASRELRAAVCGAVQCLGAGWAEQGALQPHEHGNTDSLGRCVRLICSGRDHLWAVTTALPRSRHAG